MITFEGKKAASDVINNKFRYDTLNRAPVLPAFRVRTRHKLSFSISPPHRIALSQSNISLAAFESLISVE